MLEVDPVRLAPGRGPGTLPDFSLAQYVNDRPYAASSLLGVAMADVFSTARSGAATPGRSWRTRRSRSRSCSRCCRAAAARRSPHRLFEPLGWTVEAEPHPARRGLRRVGRLAATSGFASTGAVRARRRAQPAPRPAAGPRRVQALLAGPGRGRQADAVGGGLARRPPGGGPDHPPLPGRGGGLAGWRSRGWPSSVTRPRTRSSRPTTRRSCSRRRSGSRSTPSATTRSTTCCSSSGRGRCIDLGCGPGQFLDRLVRTPAFTRIAGSDVSHPVAPARRTPAARRPDERAAGRAARAVPGRADLRGRALRGLRRGRAHGGRRARRPATAGGAGAGRVRLGQAGRGHRDHAQRRVQRALRGPRAACVTPTTGSSGRASRVRASGPTASPRPTATGSSAAASATSTTRLGPPTQMAIFTRKEGKR